MNVSFSFGIDTGYTNTLKLNQGKEIENGRDEAQTYSLQRG
jgi:hypothetical protein